MSPEVKREENQPPIYVVRSCEGAKLARTLIGNTRYRTAENSLDANMLVVAGINTLPGGKTRYVVFELPLPVGAERSNLATVCGLETDDELLEHLAIGVQAMWDELPSETKSTSRVHNIIRLNGDKLDYPTLVALAKIEKEKVAAEKATEEEAESSAQQETPASQNP